MKKPIFKAPNFKAAEFADKMRVQMDKLKFDPDQVHNIHNSIRRMTNQFDHPGPDMKTVVDFNVPGPDEDVPVRLYIPHQASQDPGPTLIYLHGGGFVTCSIESHESLARRLASGSGYRVISVDYRLAPQYPYPAGPDDCETFLKWAMSGAGRVQYGIDEDNLAISGDSAGGNMSAYLAQKYREHLKVQLLFYPLMQLVNFKPPKPGPQDWLQLGFMALKFIDEHYVGEADPKDTRLSPLFEKNLKDVPPAYILTCGLDPLRDEGKLYGDYLQAHGICVKYHHEKLMPHGFLNFSKAFPAAKRVPVEATDFLREYMEKKTA